eukprot:4525563-Pleurochrysis_carterae.AAC.2
MCERQCAGIYASVCAPACASVRVRVRGGECGRACAWAHRGGGGAAPRRSELAEGAHGDECRRKERHPRGKVGVARHRVRRVEREHARADAPPAPRTKRRTRTKLLPSSQLALSQHRFDRMRRAGTNRQSLREAELQRKVRVEAVRMTSRQEENGTMAEWRTVGRGQAGREGSP